MGHPYPIGVFDNGEKVRLNSAIDWITRRLTFEFEIRTPQDFYIIATAI